MKSSGEERGQMGEEEGSDIWGVLKIQTNLHVNWYSKNYKDNIEPMIVKKPCCAELLASPHSC